MPCFAAILRKGDAMSSRDAAILINLVSAYSCRPSAIDSAAANESFFAAEVVVIAAEFSLAGPGLP